MDAFEAVAAGDLGRLRQIIALDPVAARARNAAGASLLALAAYAGKADAIALLRDFVTALDPWEAIILGDADRVRDLLANQFDGNALSPDGFPPLALAAFFGHAGIFDLLLPLTADVNRRADNAQQVAALHAATARRAAGMVAALLRAGADADLAQAGGVTPLHAAAHHGDAMIAGLLRLYGADPLRRDETGRDAARHARDAGHDWLAALLAR